MSTIKLQSSDGEVVEVDADIAKSVVIKKMLDNLTKHDQDQIVPVPNVKSTILKKVIQWAVYHKDDRPPTDEDKKKRTDTCVWDKKFIEIDHNMLCDLAKAAYELDIKGLLELTCIGLADIIKGKKAQEIRTLFNIKNDFTPSEEEEIRKENAWCED